MVDLEQKKGERTVWEPKGTRARGEWGLLVLYQSGTGWVFGDLVGACVPPFSGLPGCNAVASCWRCTMISITRVEPKLKDV